MKSDKEIIAQFNKHKEDSRRRLAKQYANTKKCQAFYAGDIMSYSDTVQFTNVDGRKQRALVKINKVKPYVNAICGFAIQNRRIVKYEARIENDQLQELFSGYANAIDGYVRDNANADQVESQQDRDMFTNGYGAVETALSYGQGYMSEDAEGEIIIGRIDPLTLGWDASARRTNILDSRWIFYSKDFELDQALELFSDSTKEDFEGADDADSPAGEDYKYMPNGGAYDKIAESYEYSDKEKNIVKTYFYQWYDIETYYKIPNPLYFLENPIAVQSADLFLQMLAQDVGEEGETLDPRSEILIVNKAVKEELIDYFGDAIGDIFEYKRKIYYSAVISGKKVFTKFRNISQQGFSIHVKTGDFDAKNNIWVGVVNSMIDPVMYYNKALTELMFTIAANSKGGLIIEESAVEDIEEFEAKYAKTDGICVVADGAISQNKIKDKRQPHLPTGLESIVNMMDGAFTDATGIDPSFLGSREFANDTDKFYSQRVRQVTSTLAQYFDSILLYQRTAARVRLDMIKVFVENNENMTIRVIGEDGQAMFLRLSSGQLSAEFDVAIAEAPLTLEDKEKQAKILIAMGDKMVMANPKAAGVIYAKAAELLPLDFGIKEAVREALNPEQKEIDPNYVAQLEQQVKILSDKQVQAQIASIMAKAQLDTKKIEKVDAEIKRDAADTVKTLEESKQVGVENEIMNRASSTAATVDINI